LRRFSGFDFLAMIQWPMDGMKENGGKRRNGNHQRGGKTKLDGQKDSEEAPRQTDQKAQCCWLD
jgi:hypothetical protein